MDLLAQLTDTHFTPAQLVTWGAIGVFVIGGGLLGFQKLRSSLAKELKMELQSMHKAPPITVANSPLDVREHQETTPLPLHKELDKRVESLREEVHERFAEAARSSAESRGKIYDLLRDQGNDISALKATSSVMSARVGQMDGKIDQVLLRLPRQ